MTPASKPDRNGWIGRLPWRSRARPFWRTSRGWSRHSLRLLILEAAVKPAFIGYLAAASTVGSILFYLAGMPLVRRVGSVRVIQIGTLVAALGAALLAIPAAVVLLLGSLLIGLGYAPSTPAGSDLLQRYAPNGIAR